MAKEGKTISLRSKFALYNDILLAIILIVSIAGFYYYFSTQLVGRYKDKLVGIAQSAALIIDANEHEKLKTKADEQTPEYKEIKDLLKKFKSANADVKLIYTMRKTNKPDTWQFVVDSADGTKAFHIGDVYDVSKFTEIKKSFDSPIANNYTTDERGTWISGYAPILDKNGNAVAIVGVDMSTDYINKQKINILLGSGIILLVILIVSALGSRYLAAQFFKPVALIRQETEKMRKQNKYQLSIDTHGEFEDLTGAINNFAGELAATQENIKGELSVTEKQKEEFYQIYSNLIKTLTSGKLRLATPREMKIYQLEGIKLSEIPVRVNDDIAIAEGLLDKLKDYFDETRLMDIKIALSEAVKNVLKHAGEGKLILKNNQGKLRIILADSGPGMHLEKIPQELFVHNSQNEIGDKGFPLIYKTADYIIFTSSGEGTVIVMDYAFNEGDFTEETKITEAEMEAVGDIIKTIEEEALEMGISADSVEVDIDEVSENDKKE